jgi:hypothetical protein
MEAVAADKAMGYWWAPQPHRAGDAGFVSAYFAIRLRHALC